MEEDLKEAKIVAIGKKRFVEKHINRSGRTVGARLNHLMEIGLVKRNGHMYDPKQTYEMVE